MPFRGEKFKLKVISQEHQAAIKERDAFKVSQVSCVFYSKHPP